MAPVRWPRSELAPLWEETVSGLRSQTPTDHIFTNSREKISVTHDVYAQISVTMRRDFAIFLNKASVIVQILCHNPPATGCQSTGEHTAR